MCASASVFNNAHVSTSFLLVDLGNKCVERAAVVFTCQSSSCAAKEFVVTEERLVTSSGWRHSRRSSAAARNVFESRSASVPLTPDGVRRQRRLQTHGVGGDDETNFEGGQDGGDNDGSPGYRKRGASEAPNPNQPTTEHLKKAFPRLRDHASVRAREGEFTRSLGEAFLRDSVLSLPDPLRFAKL